AVGLGLSYYAYDRRFEDTDDAQVDGNISSVSARVTGTITAVYVEDNMPVKAGDELAEIDSTDYEVAVAQARAALAQAEALSGAESPSVAMTETSSATSLSAAQSEVAAAEASVLASEREVSQLAALLVQARANAKNAQHDKGRNDKLRESG